MSTLVLLRHGESEWNAKGLFTGWVDVGLSGKGAAEAARAAAAAGLRPRPDVVHTSVLTRAIQTADLALDAADLLWLPVTGPGGSTSVTTARCRARTRRRPARSSATSSSCSGVVPTTSRRRRSPTMTSSPRPATPGTRTFRRAAAPHRVPQGRPRAHAPVLVRRDRAGSGGRADRSGGRARQLAAGAGQAPRRDRRRRDRRAQHPHRHPAASTSWTATSGRSCPAAGTSTPRRPAAAGRPSAPRDDDRPVTMRKQPGAAVMREVPVYETSRCGN